MLTLYFATELEEGVIFTILISLYLSTGPNVYDVSPGCKTIVSSFSLTNNVIVTISTTGKEDFISIKYSLSFSDTIPLIEIFVLEEPPSAAFRVFSTISFGFKPHKLI